MKHSVVALSALFTYYIRTIKMLKEFHLFFINSLKKEEGYLEELAAKIVLDLDFNDIMSVELAANDFNDDSYNLEQLKRTHIMSMVIKHAAIMERFLVMLSFAIKSLENLSNGPNGSIPAKRFTDSLLAVKYIQDVILIDFNQLENQAGQKLWPRIKMLRDIRHITALGHDSFTLKKGTFNSYNAMFAHEDGSNIFLEKTYINACNCKYLCRLTSNYNVVKTMNYDSLDFIVVLRDKIIPLYTNKE